jgi:ActR/RegA family two-component response regulator
MNNTKNPEIKVAIIEDNVEWQKRAKKFLERAGITVVVIVGNIIEATDDIIPKLEKLGVSYVLLDGNLIEGRNNGAHGIKMAALIRKYAASVKIVGFSASPYQSYADIQMGKDGIHNVGKIIINHYQKNN